MSGPNHFAKRNNWLRQPRQNNQLKVAMPGGDVVVVGADADARMARTSKSSRAGRSLRLKSFRLRLSQVIPQSPELLMRKRRPLTERCSRMPACRKEFLIRFMRGSLISRTIFAPLRSDRFSQQTVIGTLRSNVLMTATCLRRAQGARAFRRRLPHTWKALSIVSKMSLCEVAPSN